MTQFYIGCKQVMAWPSERDGKAGYAVKYADGYTSWSPKDVFEQAYLPMGHDNTKGDKITQQMVDAFVAKVDVKTIGTKTTVVQATLANGFEILESSSCVDPANYDEALGAKICLDKIKDKVWHLLGFMLQTAKDGLH